MNLAHLLVPALIICIISLSIVSLRVAQQRFSIAWLRGQYASLGITFKAAVSFYANCFIHHCNPLYKAAGDGKKFCLFVHAFQQWKNSFRLQGISNTASFIALVWPLGNGAACNLQTPQVDKNYWSLNTKASSLIFGLSPLRLKIK